MSTPLKNVEVEDLEKAIAEALQKFATGETRFSVVVHGLKFDQILGRVDIDLSAHLKHEWPTEVSRL